MGVAQSEDVARDVAAINRIKAVPTILRVLSETTGLRYVTIARVTSSSWTACAVLDRVDFGLGAGDELDVTTTLCSEVRDGLAPIVIDKASEDPRYSGHRTPKMYGFESYIAVPIFRSSGQYFGNLCGLDPRPARLSDAKTVAMVTLFAELISVQLDAEEEHAERQIALLDERETAELREQFIAVLGHDLRNPLSAISFGAEALRRMPIDATALSIVERMQRSCRRISRLVEDVLDFARGRLGGSIPLETRPVGDLERDLQHVVNELRATHPDRVLACEIAVGGKVMCDPYRVAQLFSNLLSNAFAHGAADGPVQAAVRTRDGSLVISVTNQGPPIPAEKMGLLFQPYTRLSASGARGGLGLGLYIAATIARSHGGTIDVTSSAAAGTTFTCTLPIVQS